MTPVRIIIIPSKISLNHFKLVKKDVLDDQITLTYLASWLLKRTFKEIEAILEELSQELKKNSSFYNNIVNPKRANNLMFVTVHPETKHPEPLSDSLLKQYKEGKNK